MEWWVKAQAIAGIATTGILFWTLLKVWGYAEDTRKLADAASRDIEDKIRPALEFGPTLDTIDPFDFISGNKSHRFHIKNNSPRPAWFWVDLKFVINGKKFDNWQHEGGFYDGSEVGFLQPYGSRDEYISINLNKLEEQGFAVDDLDFYKSEGDTPIWVVIKAHISGRTGSDKNDSSVYEYETLYWNLNHERGWVPMGHLPEGWPDPFA